MIEIILDEKSWCENVLSSFSMGSSPTSTLNRLAKYYHSIGYRRSEIGRLLEEFILRCNPSANIMRWQDVIDNCVRHSDRRPLISIDGIPITKSELSKIGALPGTMLRRLMFTLLCLAKYRNTVNDRNDGWVSYENRDIFKIANVQTTRLRQYAMMNDLLRAGYIGMSKIVDNVSVRVTMIEEDDDIAIRVTDFRNLGNQYSNYIAGGYIECAHCGLTVKRNSSAQKYCKDCAYDMKLCWSPGASKVTTNAA